MKKIAIDLLFIFGILLLSNCGNKKSQNTETSEDAGSETTQSSISLTPVKDSPVFENAMLEMNTPGESEKVDEGAVGFAYDVKNYELSVQTADADIKMCANSAEGQHIHLILNNEPYTAHYTAEFERDLEAGHYVALSFLSRSYHESVKNPEAYVLRQFSVGDAQGTPVDLTQPHMFYSRPKGSYTGKDTEKILLDFYLVNADLSEGGYQVRATINGEEFMINTWEPKFINGLPMGTNTIKLEFLDAQGNLVDSPYNPVERTITLEDGQQQPA